MASLRSTAALAIAASGLACVAGGVAHLAGVTQAAAARDGLFDTRHVVLLLVGWLLVGPGVGMVAAAVGMRRARPWAHPAALACGGFLFVAFLIAGPTLGTPAQFVPALVAAAAVLALVGFSWRG